METRNEKFKSVRPAKDIEVAAAIKRILRPVTEDHPDALLKPLPDTVLKRVHAEILGPGDLSDDEEVQSTKKRRIRNPGSGTQRKQLLRRLTKDVQKLTTEALFNEVCIPTYNFRKASVYRRQAIPEKKVDWDDEVPRSAISGDGVKLVCSLPNLIKPQGREKLTKLLLEYAQIVTPHTGKSATSADRAGYYIHRPGQIAGEIRCARHWHGIGQSKKGLVPSSDILGTGKAFTATCELLDELDLLSHRVNEVLRQIDPYFFNKLTELRERANSQAFIRALHQIDALLLEGREFLYNRRSGPHKDRQDPQLGWAILVAFGNFRGGYVHLPHLGLRVRLEPGDAVAIRGRVVEHEIEAWEGGQRISVPHFTHTSLWRQFGMEDDVSVA